MRKYILFLLLIIFALQNIQAQDSLNCKVDKAYIASLGKDIKPLIISPVKWSRNQWIATGSVLGTAAILYSQDRQISEFWQRNQSDGMDKANEYFFDPFGKMYFTLPLMGGFYVYGAFAENNKAKRVAMDFVQASLYSGVVVTLIKHIGHRHRPYQTDPLNPYLWDGPITNDWNRSSFPSGHTIMSFTFAAVVGTHYKETIWVPIVVYSLATLEGVSRMYSNKHWSTDVLIGGALGYAIGTFVVNRNHCKLKTIPIISSNFSGLSFSYPL